MVRCYIRGLHESMREYFLEESSHLPMHAHPHIILVRASGKVVGDSQRSLVGTLAPTKGHASSPKQRTRGLTMVLHAHPRTSPRTTRH